MQSPVSSVATRSQSASPFHDVESSDIKFKKIFLDGRNLVKSKLFDKVILQIKEIWSKSDALDRMPPKRSPEPSPFIKELVVFFKSLQTIFEEKMMSGEFKDEIFNVALSYLMEELLVCYKYVFPSFPFFQ